MEKAKEDALCEELVHVRKLARKLQQENAELKKKLEEMDLEKLLKDIREKFNADGTLTTECLHMKTGTAGEDFWVGFYLDNKRTIRVFGNSLKEAIRAFRKKLEEMK